MTDTTVTYTKSFVPNSTWVEGVYFNANDNTVVVDLNDDIYRYTNVTETDALALVNADSVGAYYNTNFKLEFGPAEHLGTWGEVDWNYEPVKTQSASTVTTPKALVDVQPSSHGARGYDAQPGPTREFSLNSEPVKAKDEPTKEFSLESPVSQPTLVSDNYGATKVVVHFIDYADDVKKKYVSSQGDVNFALKTFFEFIEIFDLDVEVVKAVVKFD